MSKRTNNTIKTTNILLNTLILLWRKPRWNNWADWMNWYTLKETEMKQLGWLDELVYFEGNRDETTELIGWIGILWRKPRWNNWADWMDWYTLKETEMKQLNWLDELVYFEGNRDETTGLIGWIGILWRKPRWNNWIDWMNWYTLKETEMKQLDWLDEMVYFEGNRDETTDWADWMNWYTLKETEMKQLY